ncbi:hypothetical protein ACSLBF_02740 [Pseudoalteromonas sp. T1lg65]|uniref:hypothetical protein n=1 Tax=Pseudoalteromonas sp. T1lg65 TaxID=2077101 RepID=UPI003F79B370
MFRYVLSFVFLCSLSGCASNSEPDPLIIEKQTLHTRVNDNGASEFAFIVTVEATPRFQLSSQRAPTRKEIRKFAEQERVEDTPALKLQLEDRAVAELKKELMAAQYCTAGYRIDEVFWKERSVQLRGECL